MSGDAPTVVVDASVAVKWFLAEDESGVAEAAALLAEHAEGRVLLVAPALIAHELMGVFARRLPGSGVSPALEAFYDAGVHLVPPSRELMLGAVGLLEQCQLSAFDAAYAALAVSLGCPLATADRKLANALAGVVEVQAV
ncbi:MAG: type II toxin-antitoxin system VapC family toxin [Actinomycetota bacterium]|nr:type II toxin-antitoxin system VapC family toxin [Actinomycetota bacterium]